MVLRIHQLAKELGVKSTAIVEKCQAEGLDVKNHMSTVSVGLGETVREWFSEGDDGTAVESTAKVDLKKVKERRPKPRAKAKESPAKEVEAEESGTVAVLEKPSEPAVAELVVEKRAEAELVEEKKAVRPRRKSPKELATAETADGGLEQVSSPAAEAVEQEGEPGVKAAVAEVSQGAAEVEEKPQAPQVKAVAPKPFVPVPTKLQGPEVVRVESVEEPRVPSRRRDQKEETVGSGEGDLKESAAKEERGKRGGRRRSLSDLEGRGEGGGKRSRVKTVGGRDESRRGGEGRKGGRDWQERQERLEQASGMQLHRRERRLAQEDKDVPVAGRVVHIDKAVVKEPVTVRELSLAISERTSEIMGKLMKMGVMATVNQEIEAEAAKLVALEFGVELTVEARVLLLDQLQAEFDKEVSEDELGPRPPVVTFLGHVDHGKTSLMDRIRNANVVAGEAGGITQHIGSYLFDDGKRRVTLLDTPGHKAFTAMRARGANMTDIAVLVIAADDGVMPQTEEAISHAKAAGVSVVVAMNKIDLPDVDENRLLGQLSEKGLVPTMWGGDVEVVRTSATTGEGVSELVDHLDYIAELKQLKAKLKGPSTGWVVESEKTVGQGVVARLLIKSGELCVGDVVVSGGSYGRVRTLVDALGRSLKKAGPATPLEMTGLDEVPYAGDRFFVVGDVSRAKSICMEQRAQRREKTLARRRKVTLENLFSEIKAGELKELNVIIKADVQGSIDVLSKSILEMNTSEVAVRVLHAAVGGISESDILLAEASNAIVIGFHVVTDVRVKALAEEKGVEVRLYRVIYQINDEIKKGLEGMLAPRVEEKELGRAEVREVYKISRYGTIAGCYVTEGKISRSGKARLSRETIVIRDDLSIKSLRRLKDDASEVRSGLECGIHLSDYDDIKVGDVIEVYEQVEVKRTLESVGKDEG
ncbi:MAG: translation initiation factor IF-2 [Planctomycetes bacterium]|nr:translation initiation factor IF-2 [Planctomycetota bacterium]